MILENLEVWSHFRELVSALPQKNIAMQVLLTAIFDQKNHQKTFENVTKQDFQKFSGFEFERKAL